MTRCLSLFAMPFIYAVSFCRDVKSLLTSKLHQAVTTPRPPQLMRKVLRIRWQTLQRRPPPPAPIVVPRGTAIEVVLDQSLSSKTSTEGQSFSATVVDPVVVDGQVVIPKGAHARGTVTSVKAAGRFKGASELGLALRHIEINGQRYEIAASTPELSKKGKGKRTGAMVGGGAGGGALIGGLAGGGKGALIGGLIGAGAGTGGAAFTGNRDVTFPQRRV